jgi:uncharacterized membrane protein
MDWINLAVDWYHSITGVEFLEYLREYLFLKIGHWLNSASPPLRYFIHPSKIFTLFRQIFILGIFFGIVFMQAMH